MGLPNFRRQADPVPGYYLIILILSCLQRIFANKYFPVYPGSDSKVSITNIKAIIFSIGTCYDSGKDTPTWNARPDFEAQKVEDILEIVDHINRS
jgi:hypothetical protein